MPWSGDDLLLKAIAGLKALALRAAWWGIKWLWERARRQPPPLAEGSQTPAVGFAEASIQELLAQWDAIRDS
jgi:hypothetical protein